MNFTGKRSGRYASDTNVFTQFKLLASANAADWTVIADLTSERRERPNAYVELRSPVRARCM
ncbi:MAG: hypothetical protein FJ405_15170 [Verrucomicrobia bacterium]|nr:hypothetical protein [Verrucomicrobiota bacterium]